MNRSVVTTLAASVFVVGCGSRSQIPSLVHDAGVPDAIPERDAPDAPIGDDAPECSADDQCPGYGDACKPVMCRLPEGVCVTLPPVDCDDHDPCTLDSCDSSTGACQHEPLAKDNDHDGYYGPLPGFAPGEPGSCGDDCDDTSDKAYPGNEEVCDGVDNDCNGIVDDQAQYVPKDNDPVQVSTLDQAPASSGQLGWSPQDGYLALMTVSSKGSSSVVTQRLDHDGKKIGGSVPITFVNADAQGGSVAWTGDRYGVVWEDRREGDYEVFFNTTDAQGNKLGPDMRITDSPGFSINAAVKFDGNRFILVWQDEREGPFEIFAQLMDIDAQPIGGNTRLAGDYGEPAESPALAVGAHSIGLAWGAGGTAQHRINFQIFNPDLSPATDVIALTTGQMHGVYPSVYWNHDEYIVAWYDMDDPPYDLFAARISEFGVVKQAATSIVTGPQHERYPALLPLGDRILVVFSDDRDGNGGYELYSRMLTKDFQIFSPDVRVTFAHGQSVYPHLRFGRDGDVGVLFRDDRLGPPQVFFTRLTCVSAASP